MRRRTRDNRFYEVTGTVAAPTEVVECARSYLGTPYRDWGRQKGRAVDCIGLPILIAQELGLFRGDFISYQPTPRARRAEDVADLNMGSIPWVRPGWLEGAPEKGASERAFTAPGSVGLFWYSNRAEPTHFAIFAAHPADAGLTTIIHAHSSLGRVTEQSLSEFWRKRHVKTYWMPGVVDG